MKVNEGLQDIRERLVENGASPDTVNLVDTIMKRASLPAASGASATSLLQLVRMLMRSPAAHSSPRVYDDLVRLEASLQEKAEEIRTIREEEENRPMPKTKKYYKELKKKQS
ncbi:MAG TPA: hypothetical protein VNZ58_04525 [Thermomicrobiales bacterium]|nr:hypothetical protein [Thermomicrobiales bacterium]